MIDIGKLHAKLVYRAVGNSFMISVGEAMELIKEAMGADDEVPSAPIDRDTTPEHVEEWLEHVTDKHHVIVRAVSGSTGEEVFRGRFVGYQAHPTVLIKVAPHAHTSWPAQLVEEVTRTTEREVNE